MSQHLTELCSLLVDEVYGELSSRVFSTLLRLGRLSLTALARYTKLHPSQLKRGLAVLIQQHLVFHHTQYKDVPTYYEADMFAAYALIRSGKITTLAEVRLGQDAGELVSNLLLQGHARVGDLCRASAGASSDDTKAAAEITTMLSKLREDGFISPVYPFHFISQTDNRNDATVAVMKKDHDAGLPGSAKNKHFEHLVSQALKAARDGKSMEEVIPGSKKAASTNTKKRTSGGEGPTSKKAKTVHLSSDEVEEDDSNGHSREVHHELDDDVAVRVDLEKYLVLSRNRRLLESCEQNLGLHSARIYEQVLEYLTKKIPRCRDPLDAVGEEISPNDLPSVSTFDLEDQMRERKLEKALNRTDSLPYDIQERKFCRKGLRKRPRRVQDGGEVATTTTTDKDEKKIPEMGFMDDSWLEESYPFDDSLEQVDDTEDPPSSRTPTESSPEPIILHHLQLLARSPFRFIERIKKGHRTEWTVDFPRLVKDLQQRELEDLLLKKFGSMALRLIRILSEKGKLDEKQLSNLALVRPKDIRQTLTPMHEAGFIELQEIARDASHTASRTIFLWYWDSERCMALVLENLYKMMARLLQRAVTERKKMRLLLSKAERTDVIGNEERYLSLGERKALQIWRDKEERLLGGMMRLDRLVELFRDY
ncbi:MAG: hypothetical protein M1823_002130 [Watsoniomyces obsoletus]|nr:MAG: hypothetical protein M1823_002130 [Watsoniomyces obsoletus]